MRTRLGPKAPEVPGSSDLQDPIPNPPWGKRGLNAGRWAPYLVDGVSALRVVAEEVPGKDDPGDVGGTALLPFIPKLPCHHVHQQLGAQQALAPSSTQAQTRHQQHKPAREVGVLLGAGKVRGCPKRAVWSYW